MEEDRFCQSCAMPMGITDEHYGTEADGGKNADYCNYCYKDGKFKRDVTMEQMLETCVGFMVDGSITEEQAREKLSGILPELKRWKNHD